MAFTLGRYELLIRLGQGGGANVFLARDLEATHGARLVALKILLPRLASNSESLRAFFTEADIAARLDHEHIVAILGFGEASGVYALAMEYVFGESLGQILHRSYLTRRPLSVGVVLTIAERICAALHHAHRLTDERGEPMGLIHRDISPENILVGFDGGVKLADFGIAKVFNRGWETAAGIVKGKSRYLSPEQMYARRLDHRADLFALGIVLWEAVTGRTLFEGASLIETFQAIREADVKPPSHVVEGLHPVVDEIVLKALRRNPEQRFQTAGEMGAAIRTLLDGGGTPFDDGRVARELVSIYGDLVSRRAFALRAAVDGRANLEALAQLFDGEPIAVDQIPDHAKAAHMLARPSPVAGRQDEREPQEGLPARTEILIRGVPELDALSSGTLLTEEAKADDIAALLALEPELPEPIGGSAPAAAVGGWRPGVDTDQPGSPLYMLLSPQDLEVGRVSPAFTAQLGLDVDDTLPPLPGADALEAVVRNFIEPETILQDADSFGADTEAELAFDLGADTLLTDLAPAPEPTPQGRLVLTPLEQPSTPPLQPIEVPTLPPSPDFAAADLGTELEHAALPVPPPPADGATVRDEVSSAERKGIWLSTPLIAMAAVLLLLAGMVGGVLLAGILGK